METDQEILDYLADTYGETVDYTIGRNTEGISENFLLNSF